MYVDDIPSELKNSSINKCHIKITKVFFLLIQDNRMRENISTNKEENLKYKLVG